MVIHINELEKTLYYYNLVKEKVKEILYHYIPCRYAQIFSIRILDKKIEVGFYSGGNFEKYSSFPINWLELEDEKLREAIEEYNNILRKREEEIKRILEEEKEKKEYERLKAKFEK